ncbi:hypothetical protein ABT224_13975 [Streptomyces sp. NPDC001584]|uniref:hypothetical protein n=1 Tax=Streptomyces sp. NPDC001584 TaxID=3154521 RepID=UPI00332B420F
MHALRAVAVAVVSTVALAGCGPSGSAGDDAAPKSSTGPGTSASASADPSTGAGAGTSTGASPGATAGPTTSPTAGQVPAPGETLVRVTRTGGFAGRTHTLVVKGDGSFTRLDAGAKPTGTGKLSGAELAALRTALREADFARLPRIASGGPTIYDGYFYSFVHDGHEVASDQGSLPEALTKVLDALPPFTGSQH